VRWFSRGRLKTGPLAAADKRDDFQPVAVGQQKLLVPRAGNDFSIDFNGDSTGRDFQAPQ